MNHQLHQFATLRLRAFRHVMAHGRLYAITGIAVAAALIPLAIFDAIHAFRRAGLESSAIRSRHDEGMRILDRIRVRLPYSTPAGCSEEQRSAGSTPPNCVAERVREDIRADIAAFDISSGAFQFAREAAELASRLERYWATWDASRYRAAATDSGATSAEHSLETVAEHVSKLRSGFSRTALAHLEEQSSQAQRRTAYPVAFAISTVVLIAVVSTRILGRNDSELAPNNDPVIACAKLRDLSDSLVDVHERERQRISRALREDIAQNIAAVAVRLDVLIGKLPPDVRDYVEEEARIIREVSTSSAADVQRLSAELRSSLLDDIGLGAALQSEARHAAKRTGINVRIVVDDMCQRIPEPVATCVFRVVQDILREFPESLGVRVTAVTIGAERSRLVVSVEHDPVLDKASQRDVVCFGIQHRVSKLNGLVQIESPSSERAVIRVSLPLPA